MPVRVTGVDEVVRNLNKQIAGIKVRSKGGMYKSVLLVKGKAIKLTPVRTGNLRQSAYSDVFLRKMGNEIVGEIGYQAAYAPFVHEMTVSRSGNPIRWTKPGTGPKFLERPLKSSTKQIIQILERDARVR
jgi:hypothetical protein